MRNAPEIIIGIDGDTAPASLGSFRGLVVEAERRGYAAQASASSKVSQHGRPEWSGESDGHLRITIEGVAVTLRVREDGVRGQAVYPRLDYRYQDSGDPARRSFAYFDKGFSRTS